MSNRPSYGGKYGNGYIPTDKDLELVATVLTKLDEHDKKGYRTVDKIEGLQVAITIAGEIDSSGKIAEKLSILGFRARLQNRYSGFVQDIVLQILSVPPNQESIDFLTSFSVIEIMENFEEKIKIRLKYVAERNKYIAGLQD